MGDSDVKITLDLDAGQFTVSAKQVRDALRQLDGDFQKLEPAVKKTEERIRTSTYRFRDFVMVAGTMRFALLNLYDVFGRLPMNIMKNAGELERMQQLMTGLSKETDKVAKAVEGMRDFNFVTGMAKNAPFEINAISDAFVKLKVAGIDPTNGSLKTLVDSVARFGGDSDILKRASVAISQMAGKGVVSMEELRQQLGEAIPTAMQAMADGIGWSMAKLTKVVSTGTLSAKPAIEAMMRELRIQSDGAAADMMKTWVGMTAQLETEWKLASKNIADSGFGDAMKGSVRELTELLRSPEFTDFGRNFGAGLGTAIDTIKQLTKLLIEHSEVIKIAAMAWAAYKLQSALIAPMAQSLRQSFADAGSSVGSLGAKLRQQAADLRDLAKNQSELSDATKRQAAERVAAIRNENATIATLNNQRISTHAQMIAQIQAYDQSVIAARDRLDSANSSKQKRAADVELGRLVAQSGAMDRVRLSANELSRVIGEQTRVMNMNDRAVLALNNQITRANSSQRAYAQGVQLASFALQAKTAAAYAATQAVRGFNAVVGALGGPVGIAITALIALVGWWQTVKAKANEAGEAAERALSGYSTVKDLETVNDKIESTKKKMDDLRAESGRKVATGIGGGVSFADTERKTAIDKELQALEDDLKKFGETKRMIQENVDRVYADNRAAYYQRTNSEAVAKMVDSDRQNAIRLADSHRATLESFKGTDAEREKLMQSLNKERYQAYAAIEKRKVEYWSGEVTRLRDAVDNATGKDVEVAKKQLAAAIEAREDAAKMMDQFSANINIVQLKDPKGKEKKQPKSAFAKLAERIEQDSARLKEQLENAAATGERGVSVAGKIKALESAFAADAKKGIKLDKSMLSKFIDQLKANAADETQLRETERIAKEAERVSQFVEGMTSRLDDAFALLRDPLGFATEGKSTIQRALNDMRKYQDGYAEMARKQGVSLEQYVAEAKASAASLDLSSTVQKLAQETRQLESQTTSETRIQKAERMRLDNEEYARRSANLLAYYKQMGAQEYELAILRGEIDANNRARQQQLLDATKHPLQELGEEWADFAGGLENATVGWANNARDAFLEFAATGKLSMRDMVSSVLKDLARLYASKAFSYLIQLGIGMFTGAGNAASGIQAGASSAGSLGSIDYSLAGSGSGGLGLNVPAFENGGIMTEFGSVPLRKYANGGIARSPQLALYGEGRRPEAYVPLPDGRTIPVTMQGGAGGGANVSISIVVHNDGSESTSSEGGSSIDAQAAKGMANKIKQVVREELLAQKRQGGILSS